MASTNDYPAGCGPTEYAVEYWEAGNRERPHRHRTERVVAPSPEVAAWYVLGGLPRLESGLYHHDGLEARVK